VQHLVRALEREEVRARATGGRPERSPRFKQYSAATGFQSEVRLVFTVGGAAWGLAQLNRLKGRFTDDEKAWLDRAAASIAPGPRRALVAEPASSPGLVRGPGIVLLDGAGRVVSATREAVEWLDELAPELLISDVGHLRLPFHAYGFATRVRAAHADGEPQIRSRLRTRRGVWLLMHGAILEGTGQVALIIEPAKSADVAPLIVEAYGLTGRELEVTRTIARGLSTTEVAAELYLSPHTVRDHVKALFEKVGVSSRGELVHRVFAEHYATPSHQLTDRDSRAARRRTRLDPRSCAQATRRLRSAARIRERRLETRLGERLVAHGARAACLVARADDDALGGSWLARRPWAGTPAAQRDIGHSGMDARDLRV
jgi:DNA-binding CsgD family transcriptional regulator